MNKDQLKELQRLSRIALTPKEEEKFLQNLQKILIHIETMQEVPTDNVQPCSHVIEGVSAPLREDVPERLLNREEFLKNAPRQAGGMVHVPKVLKDES